VLHLAERHPSLTVVVLPDIDQVLDVVPAVLKKAKPSLNRRGRPRPRDEPPAADRIVQRLELLGVAPPYSAAPPPSRLR
jgi:hypothetical protein